MAAAAEEPPIPLEDFATLSAEVDAGVDLTDALAAAELDEETWGLAKRLWLARMAEEATAKQFKLTNRYTTVFRAKRAIAAAKLMMAPMSKPAEPPRPAGALPPLEEPPPEAPVSKEPVSEAPITVRPTGDGPKTLPPADIPLVQRFSEPEPPTRPRPLTSRPAPPEPPRAQPEPPPAQPRRIESVPDSVTMDVPADDRPPSVPFTVGPAPPPVVSGRDLVGDDDDDEPGTMVANALSPSAILPFHGGPPAIQQPSEPTGAPDEGRSRNTGTVDVAWALSQMQRELGDDHRRKRHTGTADLTSTIAVEDEDDDESRTAVSNIPEGLPGQNQSPRLTLEQFASFSAELGSSQRVEEVRSRYGLSAVEQLNEAWLWQRAFAEDPSLAERYRVLVDQFRAYIAGRR